jgi:hypothetical protein
MRSHLLANVTAQITECVHLVASRVKKQTMLPGKLGKEPLLALLKYESSDPGHRDFISP